MRFEVIYEQEARGQRIAYVIEAHTFDAAAVKAGKQLVHFGYVESGENPPMPLMIRRLA